MKSSNIIALIFLLVELYNTEAYNTTIRFKLRMTSSANKYLFGLNKSNKNSKYFRIDNDVRDSNKKEVSFDTMLINIYNVRKVFFNRNSHDITLRLHNKMDNIFYMRDDNIFEKITNNTKLTSNRISNIFVYEIDNTDIAVDCIIYNKKD